MKWSQIKLSSLKYSFLLTGVDSHQCVSLSGKIIGTDTDKWSDGVISANNWRIKNEQRWRQKNMNIQKPSEEWQSLLYIFNDLLFIVKLIHWPSLQFYCKNCPTLPKDNNWFFFLRNST